MAFSQWQYTLVAYALKGKMHYKDGATKYLVESIHVPFSGKTPHFNVGRDVSQNVKGTVGLSHRGNWYINMDYGVYQLDCPQDLQSRIAFVKHARYSSSNALVFSEDKFKEIIQEFLDKDASLNRNKILEYCNMKSEPVKSEAINNIDFLLSQKRDPLPAVQDENQYNAEKFLSEVFISKAMYEALVRILKRKKNIILQGAPGVGKTFIAKRLAYSMIGRKDENRIAFVQFHQNYSYEDFVIGYKPKDCGFTLTHGIFYNFCTTAKDHPDKDYFFPESVKENRKRRM